MKSKIGFKYILSNATIANPIIQPTRKSNKLFEPHVLRFSNKPNVVENPSNYNSSFNLYKNLISISIPNIL